LINGILSIVLKTKSKTKGRRLIDKWKFMAKKEVFFDVVDLTQEVP